MLLRLLSGLLLCVSFCNGQGIFTITEAHQSKEIVTNKTRYNNAVQLSQKVNPDNKYLLVAGIIKEGTDLEIDRDDIYFLNGETKYYPIGKIGYKGDVEITSVYDLRTKHSKKFSYLFIVKESTKSGKLVLGEHKIEVKAIDDVWPNSDEPRSINVVKTELLDKYEGKDEIKDTKRNKLKVNVTYTPIKGKFLVATLEVMSPISKPGKKERGKNYTFHPSQFVIVDEANNMFLCNAFLRDGYDNEFSESMNNGVLYDDVDKETIRAVFPVGGTKGKYFIYHNSKKYGEFEIK